MVVDYTKDESSYNKTKTVYSSPTVIVLCKLIVIVTSNKIGRGILALTFFLLYMFLFKNMHYESDRYAVLYLIGAYILVIILRFL